MKQNRTTFKRFLESIDYLKHPGFWIYIISTIIVNAFFIFVLINPSQYIISIFVPVAFVHFVTIGPKLLDEIIRLYNCRDLPFQKKDIS